MHTGFLSNKKIAVVGGGPGGLTLARLLQQQGIDVKVYERDADRHIRQQGATLDLHQDAGLKALREAGLLAAFKVNYRPGADRIRIVDSGGNIHFEDKDQEPADDFGDEHFRPEIDRGPLRDLLIESLSEDTVVWNSHFEHMEPEQEGWRLYFKNGQDAYADIVVAADGANSTVRSYLTDIRPIYSGVTIVEGSVYHAAKNVPGLWKLVNGGKVFAFGDEQSIILSTKEDGSLSFYTGCKVGERWVQDSGINFADKTQVADWFKTTFSGWSKDWQALFLADEVTLFPRPMYHYPLDQAWQALPNLVMIGDAAHRMPPYAGEGVNMAMLDALELYEALTDERLGSAQQAIKYYEVRMRKRAVEVTALTLGQTASLHAQDSLEYMIGMFRAHER